MKNSFLAHFQQLESDRLKLFDFLCAYPDSELNRKRKDGGWSAAQVVAHLLQAETGTYRYLQKKTQNVAQVQKAGFFNRIRTLLLKIILKSPIKFKAPTIVADVPNYMSFKEMQAQWGKLRADLLQLCTTLPEDAFEKELFRHPLAGKMNLLQMLDFFDAHFQRHLAQIEKVLAEK